MINAFKYLEQLKTDAINDANTHSDGKLSDLVGGAPTALDTLNELSNALNKDPNFAANVTKLIGDKVSKAGDTVTGTLVVSGGLKIPTGNNGSGNIWLE